MQNVVQTAGIALCLAASIALNYAQVALQTIRGDVGSENSTFYRLNREGCIRVELHIISGDADLYVSDTTLRPSYSDFELQSVTCGIDVVDIPSTFKRPVGVSVYGHPFHDKSYFTLVIYHIADIEPDSYSLLVNDEFVDSESDNNNKHHANKQTSAAPSDSETEYEESPLWTLLISILKIVLEILF